MMRLLATRGSIRCSNSLLRVGISEACAEQRLIEEG
jgi:hypothetical protein